MKVALVYDVKRAHRFLFVLVAVAVFYACIGSAKAAPVAAGGVPVSSAYLPDARVFEMVTPADNHNADVRVPLAFGNEQQGEGANSPLPFQAALNGNAVTYQADPTIGGSGQSELQAGNQYLAQRSANGTWKQINIQPPARSEGNYFRMFGPDLEWAVLVSGIEAEPRLPPLSPLAPGEGYGVLYECAESETPCAPETNEPVANPYRPLYGKPLNRTFKEFRASINGEPVVVNKRGGKGAIFGGGSQDTNHMFFEANDALPNVEMPWSSELQEDVHNELQAEENNDYLYDYSGGQLKVVNILPPAEGGIIASDASFGAIGSGQPDFSGITSSTGDVVYWTDAKNGIIYARINDERSIRVSQGPARYWTSAAEARYAFYTEENEGKPGALYRFDLATETSTIFAGANDEVLGMIGASEDGRVVYVVASAELTSESGEQTKPVEGQPNIYRIENGERPVFVATLSEADGASVEPFFESVAGNAAAGDWEPGLGQRTAAVSQDGETLVFMSSQALPVVGFPSGYPSAGNEEVYAYRANGNRLFCISCSSSGEPPPASAQGAAAFLPISWNATYLPHWISQDGSHIFFVSAEPLVPQDTNNKLDVYEWEPQGVADCTAEAAVDGGCIYLLSGGMSKSNSWLIGESATGNDVFVATRTHLTQADQNENYDLYDARVDGVKPRPQPTCTPEECPMTPAPGSAFQTPASITFGGMGNPPLSATSLHTHSRSAMHAANAHELTQALKICHMRRRKKRRAECERQARHRYGRKTKEQVDKKAGK